MFFEHCDDYEEKDGKKICKHGANCCAFGSAIIIGKDVVGYECLQSESMPDQRNMPEKMNYSANLSEVSQPVLSGLHP